jgi:WD40 repeat protein
MKTLLHLLCAECIMLNASSLVASTVYQIVTADKVNAVSDLLRISDGVIQDQRALGRRTIYGYNLNDLVTIADGANDRKDVIVWDLSSGEKTREFKLDPRLIPYQSMLRGGAMRSVYLDSRSKIAVLNMLDPYREMLTIDLHTGEVSVHEFPDKQRLARRYPAEDELLLVYEDGSVRTFSFVDKSFSKPLPDKAEPCLHNPCSVVPGVGLVEHRDGTLRLILNAKWSRLEGEMVLEDVSRLCAPARLPEGTAPCYISKDAQSAVEWLICLDPHDYTKQASRVTLPTGSRPRAFSPDGSLVLLEDDQTVMIMKIDTNQVLNSMRLPSKIDRMGVIIPYWPSIMPASRPSQ